MNDDTVDSMLEWRERWTVQMTQRSQHPTPFWQTVADRLIADRQFLFHDPCSPLGQSVPDSTDHFEWLAARHEEGLHWERLGNLTEALIVYEANVADAFHNISPYERLRILYSDRQGYEDALRVCEAYLVLPWQPGAGSKTYFQDHAERLTEQLQQQRKTG